MIYIECKPDFMLVHSLIKVARREIIHEFKGKFEICRRLRDQTDCKALIDEDPSGRQPPYVKEAKLEEDLADYHIKVFHHNSTNNQLIVMCPKLEDWILGAARETGIDVRTYDLPDEASRLHRHINLSLGKFEVLLEDLKNSSRLKTLKRLLESK